MFDRSFAVRLTAMLAVVGLLICSPGVSYGDSSDFKAAQQVLTKYCAGCHNANDSDGDFAVDEFSALLAGGESGKALTPGSAESSLMIRYMRSQEEPKMPPEGEPAPTADEVQIVADWIDAGATGPSGESGWLTQLETPNIKAKAKQRAVTALAFSNDQALVAVARFGEIEILHSDLSSSLRFLSGLPGKVTSLAFVEGDQRLLVGTGVTGLRGEAILFDVESGEELRRYQGHRDIVYSLAINPQGDRFATTSYDRKAIIWSFDSDQPLLELTGHNDAVFASEYDATGGRLVTASADATIKIWDANTAERLDTRGEPLKEQYIVTLSEDGRWIFAAGEDNRIRKWELVSQTANQTNPLVVARFAHESAIQRLQFHGPSGLLVSCGSDGAIKIWETEKLTELHVFEKQTESVQALAVSDTQLVVGRMDGSLESFAWPAAELAAARRRIAVAEALESSENFESFDSTVTNRTGSPPSSLTSAVEAEPNNQVAQAQLLTAPFVVSGKLHSEQPQSEPDSDFFRFDAKAGQRWIIQTKSGERLDKPAGDEAQQSGDTATVQLDTHITVLDDQGEPVPRVLLQAVRDSYFTFRGKNSEQSDDFRIHNWREMELNQLLYCNGEVVRLYHYPRGPDSGFNVFPNFGKRHGVFDTTPIVHALQENCFIVEPYPPGTELPGTGLPQFLLPFENDDDAERELGTDSRLTFTAPQDGQYVIRIRDARNFSAENFQYELSVKPEVPSFKISNVTNSQAKLFPGAHKRLGVVIDRIDNFAGEVDVDVVGLPPEVKFRGPISIQAGQLRAWFALFADEDFPERLAANAELMKSAKLVATATIDGKVVKSEWALAGLKAEAAPKVVPQLTYSSNEKIVDSNVQAQTATQQTSADSQGANARFKNEDLPVFEIYPGETITVRVKVERRGYNERLNFGKEEAAINLPFGVYVDNTGLNGVLIPPGELERDMFITAERWVEPCERLIFLEAEEAGRPASNPAILRVVPAKKEVVEIEMPELGAKLTDEQVVSFAKLALKNIQTEYPNKPSNIVVDEASVRTPQEMHPAFYGCFDWHSSVHGHWMLIRLLKDYPDNSVAAEIREKLAENLTAENLAAELAYFQEEQHKAFERTYGWAWYLRMVAELETWDDAQGKQWRENMRGLEELLVQRTLDYLPKLSYPIRTGIHPDTGFALGQILDYARTMNLTELENAIVKRAREFYLADEAYPTRYEPSGQDFFSSSLNEADLMRRVLPQEKFAEWLERFIPNLADGENGGAGNLLKPVTVSDVTDGYIVHLAGLDLSRAWCMEGIASALPESDPRVAVLKASAREHAAMGFKYVFSGHYEGDHWLATFAIYLQAGVGVN